MPFIYLDKFVQIIEAFFLYSSISSHLLPLIAFLFVIYRNRQVDIRLIIFYCAYSFINDLLVTASDRHLISLGRHTNYYLLSCFTIVEYAVFSLVLFLNIQYKVFRYLILGLSPIFVLFSIILLAKYSSAHIDSLTITVEYILVITFCILYFFDELRQPKTEFIYSSYKFWILVSILIYSAGTFFFFMQANNLTDEQWEKWTLINHSFTTLKNILFSVAVLMKKDEPKDHDPWKTPESLFEKPFNTAL
jgi:hypothetical protein